MNNEHARNLWPALLVWYLCLVLPVYASVQQVRISLDLLRDKIAGGWAGQMIGVAYGAPTEFRALGRMMDEPLPQWDPARIENAIHQDDLYVEMTFMGVLEDHGLDAPMDRFAEAFRDSRYSLWHANAAARRNLRSGIKPPMSGHPRYNIHANDIDFQIEADFIGLICPGLPQASNQLCQKVGRIMNYGDGLYGGMFIAGMYAAAFVQSDPESVVRAGLACIPPKSSYAAVINDLLDLYKQDPNDWKKAWYVLGQRWDRDDPCPDGALSPFNIDARLNGAYVAMGLLFGRSDLARTMEIATRCGQDSDCNASSAAGILGVILGYSSIPQAFRSGIPAIANTRFEFTRFSFSQITRLTEQLALESIRKANGKITATEVIIPRQKPRPARLEQWRPVPYRILSIGDPEWEFDENWTRADRLAKASQPGAKATLRFEGTGVAIIGQLGPDGGRAVVYVDGKEYPYRMDAYLDPDTHDNCLWHLTGLRPGLHRIKILTLRETDPRSRGSLIAVARAVVYK